MLALAKVKKNIEFNQRFVQILEVMKSIAVSQFHTLEHTLVTYDAFDEALKTFFTSVDFNRISHPFINQTEESVGVIAVTSDQGLLGGLNVRVVNTAISSMKLSRDHLIVIGEQGKAFAKYSDIPFTAFPGIRDEGRYAQAMALRNYLFEQIKKQKFRSIQVIYPRALSLVNQKLELATLLPLPRNSAQIPQGTETTDEIIFESSISHLLEYLAYLWVGKKLHEIFGLSRLAELGARYIHLEESVQRVQELTKKLKLQYFKLRHELIDQSMRELFSARTLYAD